MANSPHLFDDLILLDVLKVNGINEGSAILGKGTFKFNISYDDGRIHCIWDDNTVCTSNLSSPQIEEAPSDKSVRRGSLTFDLNPPEA